MFAAVAGGLAGQILTALTRQVEFRREDRARWIRERREEYTALIDQTGRCLAECAVLHAMLAATPKFAEVDDANRQWLIDRRKAIGDAAFQYWVSAQRHREVLRLLASSRGLEALEDLGTQLGALARAFSEPQTAGTGDADELEARRRDTQRSLERLIAVARRDVGA